MNKIWAVTGDAVGVFLLGVPASGTFGGDKEGESRCFQGNGESAIKSKGCAQIAELTTGSRCRCTPWPPALRGGCIGQQP